MQAFYQSVSSDASTDEHPNNHGADFTMELYDELYLPNQWEMALVEISYYGQHFPNVLSEYGELTICYNGKDRYATNLFFNMMIQNTCEFLLKIYETQNERLNYMICHHYIIVGSS